MSATGPRRTAGRRIVVAGAGTAGLTAALAFAQEGVAVEVYERSPVLRDIGAGLQLSPNATRILGRLGVLDRLEGAVRPPAVLLRRATSLREIGRVPLGPSAEARWGAPYLVAHRADLQQALLAAATEHPGIELTTGATITAAANLPEGASALVELQPGSTATVTADLLVAAGGVWSRLRQALPQGMPARFAGKIAWRRTIAADAATIRALVPDMVVGAFLNPRFHLVCYPIRGGREINLVAVAPGGPADQDWTAPVDPAPLLAALAACAPPLRELAGSGADWNAHPLHTVSPEQGWTSGRLALIGDAAHALTPFAAQGAAMAIEDAATLARCVAAAWQAAAGDPASGGLAAALAGWEAARRLRLARVRRRGDLNALAWHASGPVALARDAMLALMPPARLAADLDWLYGWDDRGAPEVNAGSG